MVLLCNLPGGARPQIFEIYTAAEVNLYVFSHLSKTIQTDSTGL